MTCDVIYAPHDAFLGYLAAGWRFANHVAEPMPGSHGAWSVLMEQEVSQ